MSVNNLLRGVTAVRTVQDYLRLPGYDSLSSSELSGVQKACQSEKQFWYDVLGYSQSTQRLRAGDLIQLKSFQLTTWVPRVPGLFWKAESVKLRAEAENKLLPPGMGLGVYTPVGKSLQILGGVGNVRLLPSTSGRLICATSSSNAWQGIPVLIQGGAWQSYGSISAGVKADITGVWTPMPREHAQMLGGEAGIPRYCIVVDEHGKIEPQQGIGSTTGTAWTLFEYRDPNNRICYDFTYCTFDCYTSGTLLGDSDDCNYQLNDATQFLKDYVNSYHGQALTDFDEVIPRIDATLPVNELMNREVDQGQLRDLINRVKKQALSPETVKYETLPGLLMEHFNIEELQLLTSDYLELKLEDLIGPDTGLADQVTVLIRYCEQQNLMEELAAGIIQERPELSQELAMAA